MRKYLLGILCGVVCLPFFVHAQTVFIAPHPDDAVLGAANMMRRTVLSGEEVHVIYITDGEAYNEHAADRFETNKDFAATRREEARRALSILQIPPENIHFLGFPDSYLSRLEGGALTSAFTGESLTPEWSSFPGRPFSRSSFLLTLRQVLWQIKPTAAYYTSPKDDHTDHAFVGEVMRKILPMLGATGYEYMIHHGETPRRWLAYDPEPKLTIIRQFQSQFHTPYHQYYLESFAYFPETFTPYFSRY